MLWPLATINCGGLWPFHKVLWSVCYNFWKSQNLKSLSQYWETWQPCGGLRLWIASLWLIKCCGIQLQQTVVTCGCPSKFCGISEWQQFLKIPHYLIKHLKSLSPYWDNLAILWRPPAVNSLSVTYQTLWPMSTTNCFIKSLGGHKILKD